MASKPAMNPALARRLAAALRRAPRFIPRCNTRYPVNVYHRELVKDCRRITLREAIKMATNVIAKGQRSARDLCSLNPECPRGRLVAFAITRNTCANRLWEVDVKWVFVCKRRP